MTKLKVLFFVIFFCLSHSSFAKNNTIYDTLITKSSQELIIMVGQIIEKHANFNWGIGKTSYTFIKSKTSENKMVLIEKDGGEEAICTIDLSNISLGKNIRFKDWGKKTFSIIFDKTITQKEEERYFTTAKKKPKAKKLEIMFENKRSKREDYDKIKKDLENIFDALYKKQQLR